MKLIIVILRDKDADQVLSALVEKEYRVTRIASTGGFLRRGSTTLMLGVEGDKVDDAIQIVRQNVSPELDPSMKRATIFVLDVEQFTQV